MHLVDAAHRGCTTVSASRMSPAMNSMSFSTSGEPPRRAARIVVEHAHRVAVAHQRLHQRRADEAGAAGDQDARSSCGTPTKRPIGHASGAPHRCRYLHAIALGETGRGRLPLLDRVEETARRAAPPARCVRRRTWSDGSSTATGASAAAGRRAWHELKAAHVVGGRIGEHQRAVLAVEFQPMAGAEIGRRSS